MKPIKMKKWTREQMDDPSNFIFRVESLGEWDRICILKWELLREYNIGGPSNLKTDRPNSELLWTVNLLEEVLWSADHGPSQEANLPTIYPTALLRPSVSESLVDSDKYGVGLQLALIDIDQIRWLVKRGKAKEVLAGVLKALGVSNPKTQIGRPNRAWLPWEPPPAGDTRGKFYPSAGVSLSNLGVYRLKSTGLTSSQIDETFSKHGIKAKKGSKGVSDAVKEAKLRIKGIEALARRELSIIDHMDECAKQ